MTIRRRTYRLPEKYDPWRRLLAAIVLQAVWDVRQPHQQLTQRDRVSAQLFLQDQQMQQFATDLGLWIPWTKIQALVIEIYH